MKRLQSIASTACFLTSLACGVEPAKPGAANERGGALTGTWKVVALEAEGKKAPAEIVAAMSLRFQGETVTFIPGEPGFTNFTFKLDPRSEPPGFDLIPAEGKGASRKGIYRLEGDNLAICFGATERPTTFSSAAGSRQAIYTLKKRTP